MIEKPPAHRTTPLVDPFTETYVQIDIAMVPIIAALWDAGVQTEFCCQGSPPEVYRCDPAYVSLAREGDIVKARDVLTPITTNLRVDNRFYSVPDEPLPHGHPRRPHPRSNQAASVFVFDSVGES
jgi:hypothetical protein